MREAGASASASSGALETLATPRRGQTGAGAAAEARPRARSTGPRGARRAGGAGGSGGAGGAAGVTAAAAGAAGGGGGGEQRPRHAKPEMLSPTGAAARELRRGTRALRDARDRLHRLHEKAAAGEWGADEAREAAARAAQLLREAERLQRLTAGLSRGAADPARDALGPARDALGPACNALGPARDALGPACNALGPARDALGPARDALGPACNALGLAHDALGPARDASPHPVYESALAHEMRMELPSVLLAPRAASASASASAFASASAGVGAAPPGALRSHSELELSRRLSESLDMQERLAADNAALDGKRYLLYKELMDKEQRLETARTQAARLQTELKLLARDHARLQAAVNAYTVSPTGEQGERASSGGGGEHDAGGGGGGEPCACHRDLEKQLSSLEAELRAMKEQAERERGGAGGAGAGGAGSCRGGGRNTCFDQPAGAPPMPPMKKICGVCPPCPAPCNPDAPPTPAEREAARLAAQLKQTEDSYKGKITECAMLRAEVVRRKEEAEKERCMAREAAARLRELELKFQGLAAHTDMTLGTKEQAFEQEVSVRALKRCYREAREEVDELRALLTEQGTQLQDYRVKYLQAQQLAEEQKRQLAALDMDNTRISEQINLEIQRVKIKFQEKLQELAPVPALLQATQRRLQDAQQAQARAEHTAEQLARELNCAREKVHVLLHNSLKPAAEKGPDRAADEKLLAMAQQRAAQLLEANQALNGDIERLKMNVIRMEEQVLASDKRLTDKMAECAALGRDLDRVRDEAARAVLRANQRVDTVRKCMQTSVAELEKQLATSRAQVATSEKEREELQSRMRAQIQRLQENFEQAQLRVHALQTQVMTLRRRVADDDGDSAGDGDGGGGQDKQECLCKTFFDN